MRNVNSLEKIDRMILKEMEKKEYISSYMPSPVGRKSHKVKKNIVCEELLSNLVNFKLKTYTPKQANKIFNISDDGRPLPFWEREDFVGMADWNSKTKRGLIQIIDRKYFKTRIGYYKTLAHEVCHLIGEKFDWPMSNQTHEIFAETFSCYFLYLCGMLTKKSIEESANYFLDSYSAGSVSRGLMRAKKAFEYLMKRIEKKMA